MRKALVWAVFSSAGCLASAEPAAPKPQGEGPANVEIAVVAEPAATVADVPPAAPQSEVLKHMPKDCDEGRVYANVGSLLRGGSAEALESLIAHSLADKKDSKKSEEVLKVLQKGGIAPMSALKELAVCASKDTKRTVIAAAVDFSQAGKPGDVIARAIKIGSGKAPKQEEAGDVTWLTTADNSVLAVSKSKLLAGDDRALVEASWNGTDGAAAFGDATRDTLWASVGDTKVSLRERGDDYHLDVSVRAGTTAARMKEQFESMRPEIDKLVSDPNTAFLEPLPPAVKNAKLGVDGEMLHVATTFPRAALREFLANLGRMKPEDLMKGLRF
jgi:hypothetical protein